jgi:hypothetical protein
VLVVSVDDLLSVTVPIKAAACGGQQCHSTAEPNGPNRALAQQTFGFLFSLMRNHYATGRLQGRLGGVINLLITLYGKHHELRPQSHRFFVQPSVLTNVAFQAGLDMRIPLLKPLEHLLKERILLPEFGGELVHVGVRWLALKPQLGESADDVLDPVREEEHEGEVLELAPARGSSGSASSRARH